MRTVCDVCESAPARYFCAADEAALCIACDEKHSTFLYVAFFKLGSKGRHHAFRKVHGCNKLATRHVRLQLAEARPVPRCDICENAPAFFFCGIDGTSLCLQCDMDVHVDCKRTHERYLLLGQRVESVSKKPYMETSVALQAQERKRLENQLPQQNQSCEQLHEKKSNCNASANAIAVGDAVIEGHASIMIDLNSRPQDMQGQASDGSQCAMDMEVASNIDDSCADTVPEMPLKE